MSWIDVAERVPDNRRDVLVWGRRVFPSSTPRFLGVSRYNPGDCFDIERSVISIYRVSHWAEVEMVGQPEVTQS